MPTATATRTMQPAKKLKEPQTMVAPTVATLQALYHRAARAFLHREFPLVHSLLASAFALLPPPDQAHDELTPYRSKWDLLRITFETTAHAAVPPLHSPDELRALVTQPSHALLTAAYHRSLALFTPRSEPKKAAHIPSAVILTLAYSSLKLESPEAGRVVVEDWLASRQFSVVAEEDANYRKAVEAYCLHVLPQLEQWEYAREFLEYESELPPDAREAFKSSLAVLHAQAIAERLPAPSAPPSPALSSPRPYSPTPSSSSSSSISSTTSMHTVVPPTPRPRSSLARSLSTSSSATATPRVAASALPVTSPPRYFPPRVLPQARARVPPPSTYALVKASLTPYLSSPTRLSISIITFVLLLVFPLFVRRRHATTTGANADLVRRRLAAAQDGNGAGFLRRALAASFRAVVDTVRMGGSGLV
ncbi:hypothetical protein FB45DRAFT_1052001 [Roridomyces roridus]|uniref:Uncharacterized protein n=1 Tax=Roridomyces roridus TaxID=1738132 RepID=A0AAD7CFM6_9AGAR|nr:hypothetical protein FB45DRAFT_1052001 [Roridomyces roridus]